MGIIVTDGGFPSTGLRSERLGRNGQLTDGTSMNRLQSFINKLGARRRHVLAHGGTACTPFPTLSLIGANRFHTGPNCAGVEVVMLLGPSTTSSTLGALRWTVGGVTQDWLYSGGFSSSTGPNDVSVVRQRFVDGSGDDLASDTAFNASMSVANSSVIFYIIFEIPRTALDTALHSSAAFGHDVFGHGAPILDRDWSKLQDMLWEMYRRQGPVQFCWSSMALSSPTQTGATWKNVLDGTTTGYGANAAGFWTIPEKKNRLAGAVVNVQFWARGLTNAGAGGRVRFSNSAGVLATITGFTTGAAQHIEATATLDATIATSDLVIIEHSDSAGNIMQTDAAGCYEYLT
jgi:hypothetical protein